MKQTQKLLCQGQLHQALEFAATRVVQLRWLAIQGGITQRVVKTAP